MSILGSRNSLYKGTEAFCPWTSVQGLSREEVRHLSPSNWPCLPQRWLPKPSSWLPGWHKTKDPHQQSWPLDGHQCPGEAYWRGEGACPLRWSREGKPALGPQ